MPPVLGQTVLHGMPDQFERGYIILTFVPIRSNGGLAYLNWLMDANSNRAETWEQQENLAPRA